jgi:hypothetical protein
MRKRIKMITDHKIVFISILLGFLFFMGLSYTYTEYYGIPWGMSDIDRYLCMMQRITPEAENCQQITLTAFLTHFYVWFLLAGLSPQMINYVMNMFIWLLLPLCFYIFSRDFLENKDNAVHVTIYLMYGTGIYFFFGYMMLIAQLTSFLFYLLSLSFFTTKEYKKGAVMALLAIIGHPYIIFIYLLYFLAWSIYTDREYLAIILGLIILSLLLFYGLDFTTVFFNNRPQPTLYDVFFIFTNPILTFLFS